MYTPLLNEEIGEFNEQKAAGGNVELRGVDLRGIDLRETQLDGTSLMAAKISGTYFPVASDI